MVSVEYLEEERKKIWEKIIYIEEVALRRLSEDEKDAKQSSKKCSEFRNKCEASKGEIDRFYEVIEGVVQKIENYEISRKADEIESFYSDLKSKSAAISENAQILEGLFLAHPDYKEKLSGLEDVAEEIEGYKSKSEAVFRQISARKNEIDELYYEVIGSSSTDPDTGEVTEVRGTKDELEEAYDKLKRDFDLFSKIKEKEFFDSISACKSEFKVLGEQVRSFLPDALTAGLSAAYSEKKKAEQAECKSLELLFRKYVNGLVAISIIPFIVSVVFLFQGESLGDVVLKMPRLVLSILPLYIPVLWVAYSANRKMNLSKRLIEEYTHKEVLSRTFEGLSTQIQNIEDSEVSRDLKTKLLYNILEVNSENPGKLISDYNKSDHPLMDALEKSVRLTNSIDKLARIPGMSKLVGVLERRSQESLEKQNVKSEAALDKV